MMSKEFFPQGLNDYGDVETGDILTPCIIDVETPIVLSQDLVERRPGNIWNLKNHYEGIRSSYHR